MFPRHILGKVPQNGEILELTNLKAKGNQTIPQLLLSSIENHYIMFQEKEKESSLLSQTKPH